MVRLSDEMETMSDAERNEIYCRRFLLDHMQYCNLDGVGCQRCIDLTMLWSKSLLLVQQEKKAIAGTRS